MMESYEDLIQTNQQIKNINNIWIFEKKVIIFKKKEYEQKNEEASVNNTRWRIRSSSR